MTRGWDMKTSGINITGLIHKTPSFFGTNSIQTWVLGTKYKNLRLVWSRATEVRSTKHTSKLNMVREIRIIWIGIQDIKSYWDDLWSFKTPWSKEQKCWLISTRIWGWDMKTFGRTNMTQYMINKGLLGQTIYKPKYLKLKKKIYDWDDLKPRKIGGSKTCLISNWLEKYKLSTAAY